MRMARLRWTALALGLAVLLAGPAQADVTLASVLGENMVLQQGMKAPVWGTADAGEQVTVTLCGQTAEATADANGKWQATLAPLKAGGPFEMTVKGKNTITLKNVLVGEVWVCSGQSNMAMTLNRCTNPKEEAAAATFPKIRLFTVSRKTSAKPLDAVGGKWVACSPTTAPGFSGVGYFFGRKLHQELKVPIGLINTSWGGTPAEAWTSMPSLKATPELKPLLDRWATALEDYPAALQKYKDGPLKVWQDKVKAADAALKAAQAALKEANTPAEKQARTAALNKAKAVRGRLRRQPRPPQGPESPHCPASLYNGMIAPLLPMAVKGAIWYQGESNAGRAYQYRTLFPTMIQDWRKSWGHSLSFYWVQLANYKNVEAEPKDAGWPELREAQTMTLALPNTGEAAIIDIGEARDIHPKNKQDVGLRLALNALAKDYGQKIAHASPMLDSMKVEGAKVRVKLKNVVGGLVAKPFTDPVTPSGPTLEKRFGVDVAPLRPKTQVLGFAVAGEDKKFVWADEATIDGDSVVVSAKAVAKPVAVRYAWENNPVCNLYSKAGLPACPFRSDDWKGVTADAK